MSKKEQAKREKAKKLLALFDAGGIPPGSFMLAIGELGFGAWAKLTPKKRKVRR